MIRSVQNTTQVCAWFYRQKAADAQGSARLAQGRHSEAEEEDALRVGLSLGMTLIDTAEIYSDGHSERMIIPKIRNVPSVFCVLTPHP